MTAYYHDQAPPRHKHAALAQEQIRAEVLRQHALRRLPSEITPPPQPGAVKTARPVRPEPVARDAPAPAAISAAIPEPAALVTLNKSCRKLWPLLWTLAKAGADLPTNEELAGRLDLASWNAASLALRDFSAAGLIKVIRTGARANTRRRVILLEVAP